MTSSLCPDQLQLLRFYEFFFALVSMHGLYPKYKGKERPFQLLLSKQLREWSYSSPEGVGFESRVEGF